MLEQRQGKKKTSITKTNGHFPKGAELLAAAVAIAGGTEAYAAVILFENPDHGEAGHFHWASTSLFGNLLDVTLPASSQPVSYYSTSLSAISQQVYGGFSRWSEAFYAYAVAGSLRVMTATENSGAYYGPSLFNTGDPIPVPGGGTYYGRPVSDNDGYLHYPGYNFIPEGVPSYLGVLWGATYAGGSYSASNYGWIGVIRTGAELEAFAWGYETVAGVPIAAGIPAPGTLALLAFGAVAGGLGRSRKRKET